MANFVAYIGLIVGMSLLFAMAGVQTGSYHIIGAFMSVNATSPTGGFAVDTSSYNKFGSPLLISLFAIIATFVAAAGVRSALGGTFGIAETIKTTVLSVLMGLMMVDFIGIITYLNGIGDFGGVTKFIAMIVYIPIAIMAIISGIDWIGGGR